MKPQTTVFQPLHGILLTLLVLTACTLSPAQSEAQPSFDLWAKEFKQEAANKGISKDLLDQAFAGIVPNEKVIRLDRKQPESTMTFSKYKKLVISDQRIREGKDLYQKHKALLDEISTKYGVQPRFIVALWGIETSYGKITGGYNIIEALATLAHDGRRSAFFRKELMNALKIIDAGHISLEDMKGSWAGAMGQSQFMPSSFLAFAQDYDGDGRKDIWGTLPDVFASIANYLSKSGWNDDLTWGRQVKVTQKNAQTSGSTKTERSLAEWQRLGVRKADGSVLPSANVKAKLKYPGKTHEGAYLTYHNFDVILRWNRSDYFATSVGILSDAIAY